MEIFKDTKDIRIRKNRPFGKITSKGKYEELLLDAKKIKVNNSPVPIDNFARNYNIEHLSCEPIFQLTNIITQNGIDYIVLNKEKYIEQKKGDFVEFLDWNKLLLRRLKLR